MIGEKIEKKRRSDKGKNHQGGVAGIFGRRVRAERRLGTPWFSPPLLVGVDVVGGGDVRGAAGAEDGEWSVGARTRRRVLRAVAAALVAMRACGGGAGREGDASSRALFAGC